MFFEPIHLKYVFFFCLGMCMFMCGERELYMSRHAAQHELTATCLRAIDFVSSTAAHEPFLLS